MKYLAISVYADGVGVDILCAYPETPREERILEVALAGVRNSEHMYIASVVKEGNAETKSVSQTALQLHGIEYLDRRPHAVIRRNAKNSRPV